MKRYLVPGALVIIAGFLTASIMSSSSVQANSCVRHTNNPHCTTTTSTTTTVPTTTTTTTTTTPVPPPVLFNSDFESGTLLPPWAGEHTNISTSYDQNSPRLRIYGAVDGVSPRQGTKFARFEVDHGQLCPWGYYNCALLQANDISGSSQRGNDFYTGFSLYLPSGFPYVGKAGEANVYSNNILEYHTQPPMSQAPVHFFLDGSQGGAYSLDLHTDCSGYNPKPQQGGLKFDRVDPNNLFGAGKPLITGRWVDFVIHIRWASDSSGLLEGWMDGTKRFSWSGVTWGPCVGSTYLEAGYYRDDIAPTAVLYLDDLRVGTSYASVAP